MPTIVEMVFKSEKEIDGGNKKERVGERVLKIKRKCHPRAKQFDPNSPLREGNMNGNELGLISAVLWMICRHQIV